MPRLDPEIRVSINAYLRKHFPDLCRHWFDDVEPLDVQSGVLMLLVREPVQLRYLQRQCMPQFTEATQAVTGRLLAVRFVGPDELPESVSPPEALGERRLGRGEIPLMAVGGARNATSSVPAARPGSVTSDRRPHHRSDQPGDDRAGGGVSTTLATFPMPHPASTTPRAPEPRLLTTQPVKQEAFDNSTDESAPRSADGYGGNSYARSVTGEGRDLGRDLGFSLPTLDDQTLLSPDYTFDNFVVGPGNRLAHAAAIAVAEKLGRAYNPFFVHGGVGLGKTHLLQAVCQTVLRRNPRARICYISCNTFMDLFHDAVRAGSMGDFRSRFRTADLLVIDDIHFLSKREQTQEEFFHTFNALYQAGRQIVLSSDAAPSEIPDLEERLTSRFSCGLVARIDRPCYETRVSIVKSKARIHDLDLPDDVPAYIAAKIDSNIRELEGALTKIRGVAMATNSPITLELAKQALSDGTNGAGAGQPTIQMIIEEVSRFFDVKLTDLLSKRRHKSIALPRQVCMWLARKHTRYSLEEIGGYFGGRDHTTVMHAIKTINSKRGGDSKLLADVSRLEEQLIQRVR